MLCISSTWTYTKWPGLLWNSSIMDYHLHCFTEVSSVPTLVSWEMNSCVVWFRQSVNCFLPQGWMFNAESHHYLQKASFDSFIYYHRLDSKRVATEQTFISCSAWNISDSGNLLMQTFPFFREWVKHGFWTWVLVSCYKKRGWWRTDGFLQLCIFMSAFISLCCPLGNPMLQLW